MNWFQTNLTQNPMMAEVGRLVNVMRGRTSSAMGIKAMLLFAIIIAALVGWATLYSEGRTPPSVSLYAGLGYCVIAIPLRFYGLIAGERERRSWELLRVAPVSHLQITFGKLASVVFMVLFIHTIFLIPYGVAALTYEFPRFGYYSGYSSSSQEVTNPGVFGLALAFLYSIVISTFVGALTLFFSARSKRSFTALALTLGSIMALFIVMPVLWGIIFQDTYVVMLINPFYSLEYLMNPRIMSSSNGLGSDIVRGAVLFNMGTITAFCFLLTIYAAKTLHFADDLVKFLPKKS